MYYKVRFQIARFAYQRHLEVSQGVDSLRVLRSFIPITLFRAIGAAIAAYGLQKIDPIFSAYLPVGGDLVQDGGNYVTFLATISGVGGVFIGLYYAAIVTVGSSVFARVPSNIRNLLAEEVNGNTYMGFLSFLTFFSLALIALRLLGFPEVRVAVPVVLALSAVGVFTFVFIGKQAFFLFDPTSLSNSIFHKLNRCLNGVKAGGFRWRDPSFQHARHTQADYHLGALITLADITKREKHLAGAPFIELTGKLIGFLMLYQDGKAKIPTESRWFSKKGDHKDWYRSSDSDVSMAYDTGTSLPTVSISDENWLENEAQKIIEGCVRTNLTSDSKNPLGVAELLGFLDHYIRDLAKADELETALDLIEAQYAIIRSNTSDAGKVIPAEIESVEVLALVERWVMLLLTLVLGYREATEHALARSASKSSEAIDWSEGGVYRADYPRFLVPQLEWFAKRIQLEFAVEGRQVTPKWYINELLEREELKQLEKNLGILVGKVSSIFEVAVTDLLKLHHPWLAATVVSRELEYWSKFEAAFGLIEQLYLDLGATRKIEGLVWPKLELQEIKYKIANARQQCHRRLAYICSVLAVLDRPAQFPDLGGQFLHNLGECCFQSLIDGDQQGFEEFFGQYFKASMLKFDSLRTEVDGQGYQAEVGLKIAVAPLLDLMDICGYAKVYGEFYAEEKLWGVVETCWLTFLAEKGNAGVLVTLAAAVSYTENGFELAHRSTMRSRWRLRVSESLGSLPRFEVFPDSDYLMAADTFVDHPSPIIRIFSSDRYGTINDGIDVFIQYFVREQDGCEALDFGRRRSVFGESVQREIERFERANRSKK